MSLEQYYNVSRLQACNHAARLVVNNTELQPSLLMVAHGRCLLYAVQSGDTQSIPVQCCTAHAGSTRCSTSMRPIQSHKSKGPGVFQGVKDGILHILKAGSVLHWKRPDEADTTPSKTTP